jgi:response regulator of citrate/malate metabolism
MLASLVISHMGRERDEDGQYIEQITVESVLSVFESAEIPVLTATEVAEAVNCSRPSAYNKLEQLKKQGKLHKKKVGGRAVVYIRLDDRAD